MTEAVIIKMTSKVLGEVADKPDILNAVLAKERHEDGK